MKTNAEVQDRVRSLLIQELDRRVAEAHLRLPHRCIHNHQQELDPRKNDLGETNPSYNRIDRRYLPVVSKMGLCMLGAENPEDWPGNICEDPIDAQRCPYFTPTESKEQIYETFQNDLRDPEWVSAHLPEVYGLLWVLGEELANYHVPWWKRILYAFLRIRLEPVRTVDPLLLLKGKDNSDAI